MCPFGCQTSEIFPQLLITHLLQDTTVTHLFPQKLTPHPSSTPCLVAKDTLCVRYFFPPNFEHYKAICLVPLLMLMIPLFRCGLAWTPVLSTQHLIRFSQLLKTWVTVSQEILTNTEKTTDYSCSQFEFIWSSHFFGVASQVVEEKFEPMLSRKVNFLEMGSSESTLEIVFHHQIYWCVWQCICGEQWESSWETLPTFLPALFLT